MNDITILSYIDSQISNFKMLGNALSSVKNPYNEGVIHGLEMVKQFIEMQMDNELDQMSKDYGQE
jgi:hypothetical protein